jgi:cupin fold WbuC family metalloprotein
MCPVFYMQNNRLFRKSAEVLVCEDEIIGLTRDALNQVSLLADASSKKRARICAHKSSAALIQEMIIVIRQGSYVCPHRHDSKCESFHLIEGSADIVVFEPDGSIRKVIQFSRDGAFYYRLDDAFFHTIVVRSERIIFHETTNGPFVANATEFAPFAPAEGDPAAAAYTMQLDTAIASWMARSGLPADC